MKVDWAWSKCSTKLEGTSFHSDLERKHVSA